MSAACGAQLVGRITGNVGASSTSTRRAGRAARLGCDRVESIPEYKYETGSTFQPEREQYLTLYPSDTNLERMQTGARSRRWRSRATRTKSRARSITG